MYGRIVVVVSVFGGGGGGSLIQQTVKTEPSAGHSASPSILLQKSADRSLVHSPLHGFGIGFGLKVVATVDTVVVGCFVLAVIVAVIVVALAESAEMLVDSDVFGCVVVDENEILLEDPSPFFSS